MKRFYDNWNIILGGFLRIWGIFQLVAYMFFNQNDIKNMFLILFTLGLIILLEVEKEKK